MISCNIAFFDKKKSPSNDQDVSAHFVEQLKREISMDQTQKG